MKIFDFVRMDIKIWLNITQMNKWTCIFWSQNKNFHKNSYNKQFSRVTRKSYQMTTNKRKIYQVFFGKNLNKTSTFEFDAIVWLFQNFRSREKREKRSQTEASRLKTLYAKFTTKCHIHQSTHDPVSSLVHASGKLIFGISPGARLWGVEQEVQGESVQLRSDGR